MTDRTGASLDPIMFAEIADMSPSTDDDDDCFDLEGASASSSEAISKSGKSVDEDEDDSSVCLRRRLFLAQSMDLGASY